jgi:hypothetical protein
MNDSQTPLRAALAAVLAAAVVLAAVPAPVAAQDDPAWAEALFADLRAMSETYNANVDAARDDMGAAERTVYDQIAGRTVNVYLHGTDVGYSFAMSRDGRITDLRGEHRDDARLAMYLTRDTAASLTGADDPVAAFVTAVETGRFVGSGDDRTVRGVVVRGESGNIVDQVKWGVINLGKGLFL